MLPGVRVHRTGTAPGGVELLQDAVHSPARWDLHTSGMADSRDLAYVHCDVVPAVRQNPRKPMLPSCRS